MLPMISDLKAFLTDKCNIQEALILEKRTQEVSAQTEIRRSHCFMGSSPTCIYCKGQHTICNCEEFHKLSSEARFTEIKNAKRCINCLILGHFANNCTASCCRKCKARHNTLLHYESRSIVATNKAECSNEQLPCLVRVQLLRLCWPQ